VIVTDATSADLPALQRLLALLFAQEAEFHPDPVRQEAGLSLILGRPETGTVLALRDNAGGEAVGTVGLLYTVSTFLGARVALLEDLIVAPAFRGRGGGTLLLDAAIARAKAEGCRRITLLTDAGNEAAQALYRSRGFLSSPMRPMRLAL